MWIDWKVDYDFDELSGFSFSPIRIQDIAFEKEILQKTYEDEQVSVMKLFNCADDITDAEKRHEWICEAITNTLDQIRQWQLKDSLSQSSTSMVQSQLLEVRLDMIDFNFSLFSFARWLLNWMRKRMNWLPRRKHWRNWLQNTTSLPAKKRICN